MGATGTMLNYSSSNVIHGWVGSSKWVINYSPGNGPTGPLYSNDGNAGWDGTVRMGRFILGEEITNASPESNPQIRNTAWSARGNKASTVDRNVNLPGGCGTAGKPIFGNAGDINLSQSGDLCAPDYYEGRHPVLTESPLTFAKCDSDNQNIGSTHVFVAKAMSVTNEVLDMDITTFNITSRSQ